MSIGGVKRVASLSSTTIFLLSCAMRCWDKHEAVQTLSELQRHNIC
jgi:hypothetical protein